MAAGVAALVHSIWTLDIMFSGLEVSLTADPINAIFRKFVAFLIAAAIDVGQIKTSAEIKEGQRSKWKFLTFFAFAGATYFLQWVYMIHHVPNLSVSAAIRPDWMWLVNLMKDASIWIIPALLPASTLLYTFSQKKSTEDLHLDEYRRKVALETAEYKQRSTNEIEALYAQLQKDREAWEAQKHLEAPVKPSIPAPEPIRQIASGQSPYTTIGDRIRASCPECDFVRDYDTIDKATNGLKSHRPYCKHSKTQIEIEVPSEDVEVG